MQVHDLKILPEYFEAVIDGDKTAEIRKSDRDFNVGDELWLQEWDGKDYTGRVIVREISHIVKGGQYGIEKGYDLLSIRKD